MLYYIPTTILLFRMQIQSLIAVLHSDFYKKISFNEVQRRDRWTCRKRAVRTRISVKLEVVTGVYRNIETMRVKNALCKKEQIRFKTLEWWNQQMIWPVWVVNFVRPYSLYEDFQWQERLNLKGILNMNFNILVHYSCQI